MAVTTLHRTVDELLEINTSVHSRYGEIPAVRRLLGDIERIDLDASGLDDLTPLPAPQPVGQQEVLVLDDTPHDPSLWEGADDEGLGGYHR
jgi:hypothetical protein